MKRRRRPLSAVDEVLGARQAARAGAADTLDAATATARDLRARLTDATRARDETLDADEALAADVQVRRLTVELRAAANAEDHARVAFDAARQRLAALEQLAARQRLWAATAAAVAVAGDCGARLAEAVAAGDAVAAGRVGMAAPGALDGLRQIARTLSAPQSDVKREAAEAAKLLALELAR